MQLRKSVVAFLACALAIQTSSASAQSVPLSSLPGTGELAPSSHDSFTFVAAGDCRPAQADAPEPKIAHLLFRMVGQIHPPFMIFCGDTIYGHNNTSEKVIRREYKDFLRMAATAHVPVFNAPGNHEMDSYDENGLERPYASQIQWYEKYMGPRYGRFDYGNSAFIAVDTEELSPYDEGAGGTVAPDDRNTCPGYISQRQFDWLKTQLDNCRNKTNVFLFMHHPIHGYGRYPVDELYRPSSDQLLKLISNYNNIAYVITAHEHLYYNPQDPRNISNSRHESPGPPLYLVSGGAGAPLTVPQVGDKTGPGAFHNFLIFRVKGPRVNMEVVNLGREGPKEGP